MNNRQRNRRSLAVRHGVAMGLAAFLIAVPVGLFSQTILTELTSLLLSLLVLLLIISIGIVCDVIGVAVTAAQEAPLHARAARGVFGARRAARLVRNAHQVASFFNDVIGDVSGTLSGGIGVAVVYQIVQQTTPLAAIVSTTLMSATVAGLIVGGKAYGKVYAIRHSTEIAFLVGWIATLLARPFKNLRPHQFRR